MDELISRQAAIDALGERGLITAMIVIDRLPPAQPTLCGYNIEHLAFVANVLAKENIPPERLTEVLNNTGRVVAMVREEFEESLRKAVEQCKTR